MTRRWEHQAWADPYRRAILELNPTRLPARIHTARFAVWARIGSLKGSADHKRELESLYEALKVLHLLEREAERKRAT